MDSKSREVIRDVVARIRNQSSGVSPEIRDALRVARIYLETYCAAPLEIIAHEKARAHDRNAALSLSRIHPAHKES